MSNQVFITDSESALEKDAQNIRVAVATGGIKREIRRAKTTKTHFCAALCGPNIYVEPCNHYIMRPVLAP